MKFPDKLRSPTVSKPLKSSTPLLLSLLWLCACQGPAEREFQPLPLAAPAFQGQSVQPAFQRRPALVKPLVASGQLRSLRQQLQVNLQYQQPAFRTQAFGCDEVAFVKLEAFGPGFMPLYANGADTDQLLPTINCQVSGVINDVPYGTVVVKASLYNAERQPLVASEVATAFSLQSQSQTIELSARQLPLARVVQALLAGDYATEFLLNDLDFTALQGFIDTLTGVTGSFPNYTYTTPPQLINTQALVQQLIQAEGNVAALNAQNEALLQAPAQVSLTLTGVLPDQGVGLSINDALSENQQADQNGAVHLGPLPPGDWLLRIIGEGYASQTLPVSVAAGQTLDLDTVTLVPLPPSLNSLSASSGNVGQTLTLTGTQFSPVAANNQVFFGEIPATVNSVNTTATELTITVPATAGTQAVRVAVGDQNSTTLDFAITPVIDSVTLSSGSTGTEVTLNGSGFAQTPTDNQVRFGTTVATVSAVGQNGASLTVSVPERSAGSAPVQVTVGTQSSNTFPFMVLPSLTGITTQATQNEKAVLVQNQDITLSGTNFDPVAANNTVYFGSTPVTASTATATSLTVLAPALSSGDITVSVRVNGQNSGEQTAIVPAGQLDIENGGFY
jgi:hypothetical protein